MISPEARGLGKEGLLSQILPSAPPHQGPCSLCLPLHPTAPAPWGRWHPTCRGQAVGCLPSLGRGPQTPSFQAGNSGAFCPAFLVFPRGSQAREGIPPRSRPWERGSGLPQPVLRGGNLPRSLHTLRTLSPEPLTLLPLVRRPHFAGWEGRSRRVSAPAWRPDNQCLSFIELCF